MAKTTAYEESRRQRMDRSALVVTVASVVEPFLSLQHRESLAQGRPELIAGVEIDVMAEDETRLEKCSEFLNKRSPCWFAP